MLSGEIIHMRGLTRLPAFNYYHVYLCTQNKFPENSVKPVEEKPHIPPRVVMAGVLTLLPRLSCTTCVLTLGHALDIRRCTSRLSCYWGTRGSTHR